MAPPFFDEQGRATSSKRAVGKRQDDQPANESASITQPSPTPSPSPAHHDGVPRIGGSTGGFIGLVVALSLIFIICSIAIYWLLRNHEPSARDRALRRHQSIRRKGAAHPIPIGLHEQDGSLGEKLGGMFKGRRRAGGWVQASGDEWDSGDEDVRKDADADRELVSVRAPEESRRAHFVADAGAVPDGKAASPMNVTPSGTPYSEPYASPRIHIQAPSGVTPEYWHEDTKGSYFPSTAKAPQQDERPTPTDSAEDVETFAGGTKFREIV
ncbi:hypothetical protein DENSPDRAFT_844907 [Dentipellis sp. KUC8613]|nr:hypothetical protein DENSPDRAFT_844907 [Dentipellis sp. KUC8613]